MDSLFAPWRMQWVTRERAEDSETKCLFCDLPERDADRENLIVARSDHGYTLLNNMPYNPGHVMIIPYQHTDEYHCLSEEILFDCMKTTQCVIAALKRSLSPSGFNIGFNIGSAGGASITDHLHMHVIPRWESDTSFMPLTANTAIIEEAIDETYKQLREGLGESEFSTVEGKNEAVYILTE